LVTIDRAINLAIDNIIKEGLNDIFPPFFEVDFLKNKAFRKKIFQIVKAGFHEYTLESSQIHPISHVYFPKKEAYDFRKAALIQPLDTIKYLALCIYIADEIEKAKPDKSRKIVFSYRYQPNKGYLFSPYYTFTSFEQHTAKKIKEKRVKVLIKVDIANFYERLNLHRLESILNSLNIEKKVVKLIDEMLKFWASRDSYGLPIGSNASRVLAEASLLEVDKFLMSHKVNFCRFVDDYRIFAPNGKIAHHWLSLLIERLALEGLVVNTAKTKMSDVSIGRSDGNGNKKEVRKRPTDQRPQIIVGYTGVIPTKFRSPKKGEIKKLKSIDVKGLLSSLQSSEIIDPPDYMEFLKAIVYSKKFNMIIDALRILDKFPQFTPYTVDMLIKLSDQIASNVRHKIRNHFTKIISKESYLPEYIQISIIRLLGQGPYANKNVLLITFRELRRSAGSYVGRALLESMESLINRGEVIEIRQYYERADPWERRQIIRIVNNLLTEDEKRPWLRNIKLHLKDDPFATEIFSETKQKDKGNKRQR